MNVSKKIPRDYTRYVYVHILQERSVAYPGVLFWEGGSTNSVEDRGQRERGSEGGKPSSQGFWRQL